MDVLRTTVCLFPLTTTPRIQRSHGCTIVGVLQSGNTTVLLQPELKITVTSRGIPLLHSPYVNVTDSSDDVIMRILPHKFAPREFFTRIYSV